MISALPADVERALNATAGRQFSHLFLVACGGSLSIMMAGKYFLDRHNGAFACDIYNADEFVCRDPRRLGPDTLVVLCSQTGTTKETVRAANHARARGATTIGMTLDQTSPLARAVDHPIAYQASYTTGKAIDAAYSNYGVLYMLLAGLDRCSGGRRANRRPADLPGPSSTGHRARAPGLRRPVRGVCPSLRTSRGNLHTSQRCQLRCGLLLRHLRAHGNAVVQLAGNYTRTSSFMAHSKWWIGMLASLSCWAWTRRGAFPNAPAISLSSTAAGKTSWCSMEPNSTSSGMSEHIKPYLVPLVFFDTLWRFAYKLAGLRDRPMLEGRRYMKKLSDY